MLIALHRTETCRSDRVAWRVDFRAEGFPQTWHRFYPLSWTEEQVRADVARILDREYPASYCPTCGDRLGGGPPLGCSRPDACPDCGGPRAARS